MDKLFRKTFEQLALENLSETQFKELTGNYETERQEFIEKIVVYERSEPWKKNYTQQVYVYINFVGKV